MRRKKKSSREPEEEEPPNPPEEPEKPEGEQPPPSAPALGSPGILWHEDWKGVKKYTWYAPGYQNNDHYYYRSQTANHEITEQPSPKPDWDNYEEQRNKSYYQVIGSDSNTTMYLRANKGTASLYTLGAYYSGSGAWYNFYCPITPNTMLMLDANGAIESQDRQYIRACLRICDFTSSPRIPTPAGDYFGKNLYYTLKANSKGLNSLSSSAHIYMNGQTKIIRNVWDDFIAVFGFAPEGMYFRGYGFEVRAYEDGDEMNPKAWMTIHEFKVYNK